MSDIVIKKELIGKQTYRSLDEMPPELQKIVDLDGNGVIDVLEDGKTGSVTTVTYDSIDDMPEYLRNMLNNKHVETTSTGPHETSIRKSNDSLRIIIMLVGMAILLLLVQRYF